VRQQAVIHADRRSRRAVVESAHQGAPYAIEVWDCKGWFSGVTRFILFYMKRVSYAGGSFVSGDRIVDAVTRFAAASANAERAAEIEVPAIDIDGRPQKIAILLGPASQMFAEPVLAEKEFEDEEFVTRVEALTEQLVAVSGVNPSP
jgi:hypothetical protein